MTADPQHPEIAALVERHADVRNRVCDVMSGKRTPVMRIPADRERDDDLVVCDWIDAAAAALRTLARPVEDEEVRQLDALRAEFDQLFGRFTDESARATRAEQEIARLREIVVEMDGELRLARAALGDRELADTLAHINYAIGEAERALAAAAGAEEPR